MDRINLSLPNVLLLLLTAGLIAVVLQLRQYVLKHTLDDTHQQKESRNWNIALGIYGTWLLLIVSLTFSGFFEVTGSVPPRFALIFVALPLFSTFLILQSVHKNLDFLKVIPPAWLIYIQSFRIVVEIVLFMLFLESLVPKEMTFEGRNFDMLVGLVAPLAGYLLSKRNSLVAGLAFNIFGLLALTNIVTIVVWALPSSFQTYDTIDLAFYFPGILIPALLAPFAVYLHILSIKQLLYLRSSHAFAAVVSKSL